MDLFAITCTTCKSRLNVRDRAAIGQILACPKCGGMVMVKPPPAWNEASEQKSDVPTAAESGSAVIRFDQTLDSAAFDVVDELLSDAPPKVQPQPRFTPPPEPAEPPKPRFVGGPPPHRSPPPSATPNGSVPRAASSSASSSSRPNGVGSGPVSPPAVLPAAAPPPPPPKPAVAKPDPNAAVGSPARRYWIFMAASVALGIVLAFAAVTAAIFFVPRTNLETLPALVTSSAPRSKTGAPSPTPVLGNDANAASAPTDTTSSSANSARSAPPIKPEAAAPTASTANADGDPLGLVKEPSPTARPPRVENDSLAKLERWIGGADDPTAKASDSLPAPRVISPATAEPARPPAPRPPPREIDVAKRLADPLSGIETTGTPLADFLQIMSDLSTIPITLDLPLLPATTESPVAVKLTNTTVGTALSQALAPLRLEYVAVDDQLIIRRIEPNPRAAVGHPVSDLARDEQEMTDLCELLKSVVEPAAWEEGADGGTIAVDAAAGNLIITQGRAVQFQVLWAIEKLRRSRKLPHVLRLDPALFALETRSAQAKARLLAPVSLNYGQPTRLVTILDRLGEAAGVRLVVDWRDVAAAGWNPAAEASLVVDKTSLEESLNKLLQPLDLSWRIIDGQTIQVVTPARLAEQGELEFYPLGDLAGSDSSGEAIVGRLRAALGDGTFRDAGGSGEIRFVPEGKYLLAWLPQPKQRELEALLAKWRSDAAAKQK